MIGDVTVQIATDNALELFAPVNEHEYLGYGHGSNGTLGAKGYDPSILEGYEIIDGPKPTAHAASVAEHDVMGDEVCLHAEIVPNEDGAILGTCSDCGDEFELPDASSPRG